MALIKSKTERRITGDYWLIEQHNRNRGQHPDHVVTMACYVSKQARIDDIAAELWQPTGMTVSFNFTIEDHPLDEIDPDLINPDWMDEPEDVSVQMLYLHIRAVGQAALLKPEEERTPNEQTAIWFADAEDDVP
jgi:hypothetical protein